MLIDTHVHVWALDDQHCPAPDAKILHPTEAAPVEWLLDDMRAHRVDHCVLVQSSAFGWDNTYMVECLERYPGRFRAIGLVDPLSPGSARDLQRWIRSGLSGFRFHPLYYPDQPIWVDSPEHDPVWRAAAETGAILQYHILPAHAPALALIAARYPEVRIIVDHLGKPDMTEPSSYPSFEPVLRLAQLPNVWVKIGDYQIASKQSFPWVDTYPFVAALRRAFGPDRMIWGTGYAGRARLVPLEQALQYVRGLPCFSQADLDRVLGETPKRLFGL